MLSANWDRRHMRLRRLARGVNVFGWTADDRTRSPGLTICLLADENQSSLADRTAANEPPPIRQLSAPELKALIERCTAFELVDVRTDEERARARIDGSHLLDQAYHDALLERDLDTPNVFPCHHGVRSQQAAEYFWRKGFRNLSNLQGGIDAWSLLVDPMVPRY